MRGHARQIDREVLGPSRPPVMPQRAEGAAVRAAMDLQHLAGNRSVTELVERSRADPDPNPMAVLAGAARTLASAEAGGAAVSVQREPCIDCPEAAVQAKAAGPGATLEPGEPG
ncbi:MAG: hypothetical protein ABIG85_06485 [Chloroflexota bacterium]